MIFSLLVSFAVTVMVELSAAFLLGLRDRRSLALVFLVNAVTNPVVVYLLNLQHYYGILLPKIPLTILLECSAVAVEALLYRIALKGDRHPLFLALVLNAASYLMGIVVNIIIKQVLL